MGGWKRRMARLLQAAACAAPLITGLPALALPSSLVTPAPPVPSAAIVLRTVAQEGTEPKFILEGKDRVSGLCIDLMRAIEQADTGLRFSGEQQWEPLVRAYAELASGVHDVQCAVQRTAEREQKFHFIGPALYNAEYFFLARMQDNVVIRNWDDVRRLAPDGVVLVNRGYASADMLAALGGIEVDASSSNSQLNLQKLIAGRARLYFHRSPGLRGMIERSGAAGKVRILPQVMHSAKLYFAVSKKLDSGIASRLERALFQLEKSGELARLVHKWD